MTDTTNQDAQQSAPAQAGSAVQAHNKQFTPMEARGTLVYLGRSGGFDVRDCPDAADLAQFIAAACNAATHPAEPVGGTQVAKAELWDAIHQYVSDYGDEFRTPPTTGAAKRTIASRDELAATIDRLFATERAAAPADQGGSDINDDGHFQNLLRGMPALSRQCVTDYVNNWGRSLLATSRAEEWDAQTAAARDVLAERRRQVEKEGWAPEHDDDHADYSLSRAAATYALAASVSQADRAVLDSSGNRGMTAQLRSLWPSSWSFVWFKPKNRRADLTRAGALILAEIERLDRATQQPSAQEGGAA